MFRAVIFDLDGTLVDSLGDIADAMNATLAARGHPGHAEDAYRRMIGDGVLQLAQRVLPAGASVEVAREVVREYRARYAAAMTARTRPYDGIAAVLDALDAARVPMAVLSNKSHEATVPLCDVIFPRRFARVYGERAGVPRKPDPAGAVIIAGELGVDAAACAFVGDSAIDMETARRAGMRAVGAAWGFRGAGELAAAGADDVVATARDLLTVLGVASHT